MTPNPEPDWATIEATKLFKKLLDHPDENGTEIVAQVLRVARANAIEEAAKVICNRCADTFGEGNEQPHYSKTYCMWVHGETWRCDAGEIHALKESR